MTSTDSLPESEDVPNRAVGYMQSGDAWVPNTDTLPWRGTAAGGGDSIISDLMRFAEALGSGKSISKTTLDEATRQQQDQYGYGFTVGQEPVPNYGHGGGAPGMNGDLRVFPPTRLRRHHPQQPRPPSRFQPRGLLHAPNASPIIGPRIHRAPNRSRGSSVSSPLAMIEARAGID
jgi:hypothetical protein